MRAMNGLRVIPPHSISLSLSLFLSPSQFIANQVQSQPNRIEPLETVWRVIYRFKDSMHCKQLGNRFLLCFQQQILV